MEKSLQQIKITNVPQDHEGTFQTRIALWCQNERKLGIELFGLGLVPQHVKLILL
jgi:hypothetical protein